MRDGGVSAERKGRSCVSNGSIGAVESNMNVHCGWVLVAGGSTILCFLTQRFDFADLVSRATHEQQIHVARSTLVNHWP